MSTAGVIPRMAPAYRTKTLRSDLEPAPTLLDCASAATPIVSPRRVRPSPPSRSSDTSGFVDPRDHKLSATRDARVRAKHAERRVAVGAGCRRNLPDRDVLPSSLLRVEEAGVEVLSAGDGETEESLVPVEERAAGYGSTSAGRRRRGGRCPSGRPRSRGRRVRAERGGDGESADEVDVAVRSSRQPHA